MLTPQRVSMLFLAALLGTAACDVRQEQPVPDERELMADAMALYREGSYQKAEERLNEVIPLLYNRARLRELSNAHAVLGRIAFGAGRFRAALLQVDSAILASQDARDYRKEAAHRLLKGDFLADLSDYVPAQEAYDKALSLYTAFNDRRARNHTFLRKGRACLLEGRSEDALSFYNQALGISVEDAVGLETAEGLAGVAQAYFSQGLFAESAGTFAQARDAAATDPAVQARTQLGAARALRALGDLAGASEALAGGVPEGAEPQEKALRVQFLFERSLIARDRAQDAEAMQLLDEALRQAEEMGDQIALQFLALFRVGLMDGFTGTSGTAVRPGDLIERYDRIANALALLDNRTGEAYARIQKSRLLRKMNRFDEARAEYSLALEVEDDRLGEYMNPDRHFPYLQELGLGPVREGWYREYATLLVQLNDLEGAVRVMERARLKRQFTVLRQSPPPLQVEGVEQKVDSVNSLIRYITGLQREISGMSAIRPLRVLPQQIGELKKELKEFQASARTLSAEVAHAMPNYAPVVYLGEAPILNLQPLIPPGTAVVQYLPGDDELLILVMTGRRLELRRSSVGRVRLADLLKEYMTLMKDPIVYAGAGGEASVEPMLRFAMLSPELYALLFKPIEPFFGERIVVIPDGMFEGFPLHALEQQGTGGEIRYLVEIVAVEYAPTLTSMTYRTIEQRPIRSVTGIGNPTGRDWSIDYELRDLRSFFKEAEIYTGVDATWTRLMTAVPDLLILATDFINPVPDRSFGAIGLADGITSGELSFIPFERLIERRPVPVLMLSNHYAGGSGLRPDHANLVRLRGSPEVLLNAWPADRKASKFFSEFYVTHLANGLLPSDAYRQALFNMIRIREVQHPRSWGQFFHFGGLVRANG